MARTKLFGAAIFAAFTMGLAILAPHAPAYAQDYAAVLASPDRSEADKTNDAKRKALELLTFAGPKTGWRVLDMGAGAGYSTELMVRAVGPTGKVWGQNDKASERFAARLKSPAMADVQPVIAPFDTPAPVGVRELDLVTFFFAYHDTTFMDVDRAKMNKAIFDALKPGGFLVIADHSAKPGEGVSVGKTTHRIEESALVAEVTAAGFKHVATGDFLRNPDDPRTESVHRSGIRNDEFVVRFQKP
ncbi:MAG: methyltransferase [Hyphomicrobiales bacterium]|nr:methyltransferase [Hyphomicrobiales bacterium]